MHTLRIKTKTGTKEILVEKRKIPAHKFFRGAWQLPRNREVESGDWSRDVHDARLNSWKKVAI